MPGSNEMGEADQPPLNQLIPLSLAAKISGLSPSHLRTLIREGELWGDKLGGRNWYTTEQAVREYLARGIKPGPKPQK
jgi:hypothetical protein